MIKKLEINNILKENFQRQLAESDYNSLPADLANGYATWVRSLIQAAAQQEQTNNAQNASQPQPQQAQAQAQAQAQ